MGRNCSAATSVKSHDVADAKLIDIHEKPRHEVDRLYAVLERMDEVIVDLTERLKPVLCATGPDSACIAEPTSRSSLSLLVDRVAFTCDRLEALTDRVEA